MILTSTSRAENERQNGLTTKALKEAPVNSVYVWCNDKMWYPIELLRHLKRTDILVVQPSWLETSVPLAIRTPIILDHALHLTPRMREIVETINRRNQT